VVRAACHGEAEVSWQLEQMPPGWQPHHAALAAMAAARSLGERLAQATEATDSAGNGQAAAGPDQRSPQAPGAQPDPQE
jgi:hypothetical protein